MDSETGLLPHEFTYPGILLGLALSSRIPTDNSGTQFFLYAYGEHLSIAEVSLLDSVFGALVGAGFFFVAAGLYFLVRRRQGMGTGDFALIAMVGAFLGLKLTLLVIFLAPLVATVYSLIRMVHHAGEAGKNRTSVREMLQLWEIPFGVFITISSLAVTFFGEAAWRWYMGFF